MNRIAIGGVMLAAAVTITGLAACGGGQPATVTLPPAQATTAKPANPVPILRKTGVPVPASEVNGTVGCCGDRVANGTWPSGEEVWVFTYATAADMAAAIRNHTPSDGETSIQGPGLTLLDVDSTDGTHYPVPAAVIAARVGGKVTGP